MGAAYCQSYLWRNTNVYHLTKICCLINSSEIAGISWMLVVEDVQRLIDQSLFLLACVVVTLLRTSSLKFTFLTLRGNLTGGFLNIQFSPARMMMLTISTLGYWTCSLESKKLCKVLTLQ